MFKGGGGYSALLDRECDDVTVEPIGKILTFYSYKSSLYQNKFEVLPKLPKIRTTITKFVNCRSC